jgi:hypothetical protein
MLAAGDFLAYLPPLLVDDRIRLIRADYGHASNSAKRVNVVPWLQRRIDNSGGGRLEVGVTESLFEAFGDPAVGMMKRLRIEFDVWGRKVGACTRAGRVGGAARRGTTSY